MKRPQSVGMTESQRQNNQELNDQDIKAYIYQSLSQVEGFLTEGSVMNVMVGEPQKQADGGSAISVVIKVELPDGEKIQSAAKSESIFDAIEAARLELTEKLTLLQSIDPKKRQARNQQIKAILSGQKIH